jgi:hypothetical protein
LAALGSILRPRNHCLCCRARSNCFSGSKTGYRAQNFAAITKDNAEVFQVLIGQVRKDGEINAVFGKTPRILRHAEFLKPIRPHGFNAIRSGPAELKSHPYAPPCSGVLSGSEWRFARKNNPDFSVFAGPRINLY